MDLAWLGNTKIGKMSQRRLWMVPHKYPSSFFPSLLPICSWTISKFAWKIEMEHEQKNHSKLILRCCQSDPLKLHHDHYILRVATQFPAAWCLEALLLGNSSEPAHSIWFFAAQTIENGKPRWNYINWTETILLMNHSFTPKLEIFRAFWKIILETKIGVT